MSRYDPPSDPFGDVRTCRRCDRPMIWDDWDKEWYCNHGEDEEPQPEETEDEDEEKETP